MAHLSVALIQQYAPHEGKHATYETIAPPERHPRECVQQMDQHDQQQQTADRADPYTEAQRESHHLDLAKLPLDFVFRQRPFLPHQCACVIDEAAK
jgi:hypothetical protein